MSIAGYEPTRLSDVVSREFWRGRRVLVTGASGFKGSWLCEVLRRTGAHVTGTVRSRRCQRSFFVASKLDGHIDTAELDVTEYEQVQDLVNSTNPDVIFHLAAKALVPVCRRQPRRAFETNIMGAVNLLEACRQLGFDETRAILICSTDHVFGSAQPGRNGFAEDAPVGCGGPYDTSKAAMELAVQSYVDLYRTGMFPRVIVTRCANVYGPGDVNLRRIIPEFIHAAQVRGDISPAFPMNRRQYIYVLDAIGGYMRAVEHVTLGTLRKATFHFAPAHQATSALELAQCVAEIARKFLGRKVTVSETRRKGDYAPNELGNIELDCAATREQLNWEPRCSLENGLIATYRWAATKDQGLGDALADILGAEGL